jgi:hypothetical protein
MKKRMLFSLIFVIMAGVAASAGTLTFPNNICSANTDGSGAMIACADWGYINQGYGDSAQLDVQYVDHSVPGQTLRWWSTGYNNLPNAVWGGTNDCGGCSNVSIVLVPTPGYTVTLNGFDVGAYFHTVRDTNLIITEIGTGNILANYGLQTIGTGDVAVHFAPGVSSSLGIDIRWYDSAYNVGIDNVDFTVTGVPEPATLSMLGLGLIAAARRVRRHLS